MTRRLSFRELESGVVHVDFVDEHTALDLRAFRELIDSLPYLEIVDYHWQGTTVDVDVTFVNVIPRPDVP